ncbi:hypothetical protein ACFVMC_32925 [Nocardia sp. NPDC127579]|uniref:hypothetical protein n=1 Tax=Nocardia sp. NPDC127579 TaxID=3345402 RepID=UPI00364104E8
MTIGPYRYICPHCLVGVHDTPFCPFRAPAEHVITPAEMVTYRRIRELERQGVIPPLVIRWRWLGYGLLAVVLFILFLIIF